VVADFDWGSVGCVEAAQVPDPAEPAREALPRLIPPGHWEAAMRESPAGWEKLVVTVAWAVAGGVDWALMAPVAVVA
jgi:hypothetical protein